MGERLTREDVKKIEEELNHRRTTVRTETIEAVKVARAQGDLSENFEYYAAKREKNMNESRIRYLEQMLKHATVIETASAQDEIGLNNTVELYVEEDDETEVYRIVTSIRSSTLDNKISIESPMGQALLGHRVGDRVLIRVNDSYSYYVVVKRIEKTQSEDGDSIRSY